MQEININFGRGEYICQGCGRTFPTHYRLKDSSKRAQFGRRYVSSLNNVMRHAEACKGK